MQLKRGPIGLASLAVLFVSLLSFSSCTSAPGVPRGVSDVFLSNRRSISLLPLRNLPGGPEIIQSVSGSYGKQSYQFQCLIEASADRLTMTAINLMGARVYTLDFDGTKLAVESSFFGGGTKLEYLILDFQLCYYPDDVLDQALSQDGYRYESSPDKNAQVRRVWDGKTLILEISRKDSVLKYHNFLRDYQFEIEESS